MTLWSKLNVKECHSLDKAVFNVIHFIGLGLLTLPNQFTARIYSSLSAIQHLDRILINARVSNLVHTWWFRFFLLFIIYLFILNICFLSFFLDHFLIKKIISKSFGQTELRECISSTLFYMCNHFLEKDSNSYWFDWSTRSLFSIQIFSSTRQNLHE